MSFIHRIAMPAALLLLASPAIAQDAAPAPDAATPAAAPDTAKPAKPPSEVELLRAEAADLRRQLDRQTLVADNARAQLAQAREEAKLKDELLALGRTRNAELLAVGREILERYRRKGLGSALVSAEPFVQSSRVRMENLVQDYEDKLRAARFTADTLPPSVEARMQAELGSADAADTAAPAPAAAPDQN